MAFYICDGNGNSIDEPTIEEMQACLDGLDPDDEEHGAAWLADENENSLEHEVGGNLCFSSAKESRHLPNVSKERVLQLWVLLSRGQLAELEREPWQPGTRPPMPPDERAARERVLAESKLESDRDFWAILGPERPDVPCRDTNCSRGAVSLSVLCRRHHFESVRGRPCPFDE